MASSASYFPREILEAILLRLKVKSLLRCRTVSKYWLSMISDPQFIESHTLIAAKRKPSIIVNERLHATPKDFKYMPVPKLFCPYHYRVLACCNGIVCIFEYNGECIYLWNPSTKQYKSIDVPMESPVGYKRSVRFGYDSISNDYKVLCVDEPWHNTVKVHLFSTKCGFWREIRVNIPLPRVHKTCNAVINGILYFEGIGNNSMKTQIISFDLHKEVFGVIELPWYPQHKASYILDFEGSPAIFLVDYNDVDEEMDQWDYPYYKGISLWMLEDGAEVYWIKKFTIEVDELSWIERPRFDAGIWVEFFLGNGKIYGRNYVGNYDPVRNIISHFSYDYKKKEGYCFDLQDTEFPDILKYTESLVSINGFEPIGWPSKKKSSQRSGRRKRRRQWAHEVLHVDNI